MDSTHTSYFSKGANKQQAFKLVFNQQLQPVIAQIRRNFAIKPSKLAADDEAMKQNRQVLFDDPKLRGVANLLATKFALPERWVPALINYIIEDDISVFYDLDGIRLYMERNQTTKEVRFLIEINETTSINEIKKAWSDITKSVKENGNPQRRGRKKPSNFLRDYRIYELAFAGNSWARIAVLIENEFGGKMDPGNARKAEAAFRRSIGANRKNRIRLV